MPDWKTLSMLAMALVAGVVGSLLPDAQRICDLVAGGCVMSVFPAVKTWGKGEATPPQ